MSMRSDLPLVVLTRLAVASINRSSPERATACPATVRFLDDHRHTVAFERVCGNGFALRDCLALMMPPDAPELATWASFMEFLQGTDEQWSQSLIKCIVRNRLDYLGYPASYSLDIDDRTDVLEIASALASAEIDEGEIVTLLTDSGGAFKAMLLDLVGQYWERVARDDEATLQAELEHARALYAAGIFDPLPSQAFSTLTGLEAPAGECARLDDCQEIVFLLAPGQGGDVSLSYLDQRAVVAFEPKRRVAHPEEAAGVMRALGRSLAVDLVLTLAEHGEMYVSELIEHLGAPQATVSSQLSRLERANIVSRRAVQRRIYYRLNPAGLDSTIATLSYLRASRPKQFDGD